MPYFAVSDKVSIHMNVKRLGQDMHEFSGMHAISRDSQAPLTFASLMEKPHESAESVKKFMKAQA